MVKFPSGGLAVIIGSSGGIGTAFIDALKTSENFAAVIPLSRRTTPPLDLLDDSSIAAAAAYIRSLGQDLRLVITATRP